MKYFILAFYLLLTSCAYSVLVKECKEVKDDDKYVCKTIKPWE